jgi:hypothetical protein
MLDEIESLFNRQLRAWPQLANGLDGLADAKTRRVRIDWFDVFVRHIPHRLVSTTAPVDQEAVAKRPCFLCPPNLPPEEEGLRFDQDFTIYCNPFPIVERHLTIAYREHCPQRIANHSADLLNLAAALPGYFVIYNGPECGASAPDHLHFQAGSRQLFPIEWDTAGMVSATVPEYARKVFLLRDRERSALVERIDLVLDLLAETTGKAEPLVNLAAYCEKGEWVAYVFPRGKHRPEAFHTGELTVSPASIDLCGIFVVPLARDFARITGKVIASIFREVTLPSAHFAEVVRKLEGRR